MRILQLDGLRAIAVLLVIASHHGLYSGWIGVDIFFVLSGFLITGILLRQRTSQAYWRPFYIKRATRILPPVVVFLLLAALCLHHFYPAFWLYLFFLGNLAACTRYAVVLLDPLWSLAVEEHFYIVWPWVVKASPGRRLAQICVGILVLSPFLRFVTTLFLHAHYGVDTEHVTKIYFATPCRLDGLAAGALLAILCENRSRLLHAVRQWSLPVFGVTALAFFAFYALAPSFSRDADSLLFNSIGYSVVTLLSFALVAHLVLKENAVLARFLRLQPLVYIGQVSYGIYLYHMIARITVLHSAKLLHIPVTNNFVVLGLDTAVAIAFASLSFFILEKPIIEWGKERSRAVTRRAAVLAA